MQTSQRNAILGMDVGGSNIFSVAYEVNTKTVLMEEKIDTEARNGYQFVLNKISKQILKFKKNLEEKNYNLIAIGLGIPGIIDKNTNIIELAPNLNWNRVSILEEIPLDKEIKNKIVLINDVNAGLYGELLVMPDKKPEIVVAFFCGTGIGGSIAINGEIITGAKGTAGEVGHMIVKRKGKKCMCGRKGCLEAYIGKWALNLKIRKNIDKNKSTVLKSFIDYDLEKTPIKSSTLRKAYLYRDPFTKKLLEKYYCSYLGIGISQVVNFINPELVILGGGIMEELGQYLIPHIQKYIEKYSVTKPPELLLAQLGDYAGPLGSAYYAYHQISKKLISL